MKGEWLLRHRPDGSTEARTAIWQSIHQARQQKALLWELRAAISLARHDIATHAGDEARELLLRIIGKFEGGPGLPEVHQARVLLARLVNADR